MKKINERLIEALEENGGYCNSRHDRYPIAYNVKIGHLKLTNSDYLLKQAKVHGFIPIATTEWHPTVQEKIEEGMYGDDDDFNSMLENMREGVLGDDTYRTFSTDTAKRFGLPDEVVFDVKFGFAGRSGGYIVIKEFEGRTLRGTNTEDLCDNLRNRESSNYSTNYTNKWCRHLLAMMYEWDTWFTSEAATREMEYQFLYYIAEEHNEAVDADELRAKEQGEVAYWQTRDGVTETI